VEIKNRYILLAVVLNFTKILRFFQEKSIILAVPTPF